MELFNEFGIIILSYVMMTFTSFVLSKEATFLMGYVFVSYVAVILLANITFMLWGQIKKAMLNNRKKMNQMAYSHRFADHSSVVRLSYMYRLDRNFGRINRTFMDRTQNQNKVFENDECLSSDEGEKDLSEKQFKVPDHLNKVN